LNRTNLTFSTSIQTNLIFLKNGYNLINESQLGYLNISKNFLPIIFNNYSSKSDNSSSGALISIDSSIGIDYTDFNYILSDNKNNSYRVFINALNSQHKWRYYVRVFYNYEINIDDAFIYKRYSQFKKSYIIRAYLNLTNLDQYLNASIEIGMTESRSPNQQKYPNNISSSLISIFNNLAENNTKFNLMQTLDTQTVLELFQSEYDLNSCISNCSNRGSCRLNINEKKFECNCDDFYTGATCNIDIRPCSNNPCINNSTCINIPRNDSYLYDFKCNCDKYYYGIYCENKINLCQNETCTSKGLCIVDELNNTISCRCFNLYFGDKCEFQSQELILKKQVVSLTSIIAIVIIALFYSYFIFSDLIRLFSKKNKQTKLIKNKPKVLNEIPVKLIYHN
jgi:hypothetical protein